MANVLMRQKYFFTLIFMTFVLYFIYSFIYLSVKNRYRFWKYSGTNMTSPEFICEKNKKCKLDGQTGYFDGTKDDQQIYKFPNSSDNHQILNIDEKDQRVSYSFLLYLDNRTSVTNKTIFQVARVVSGTPFFKIQHNNGNFEITNLNSVNSSNVLNVPCVIFNKWFHVILSFDTDILDVYINGELTTSNLLPDRVFNAQNPNFIQIDKFAGKFIG